MAYITHRLYEVILGGQMYTSVRMYTDPRGGGGQRYFLRNENPTAAAKSTLMPKTLFIYIDRHSIAKSFSA